MLKRYADGTDSDGNSSSTDCSMVNSEYMKNVLVRFITGSDYESVQLVRAVAVLLRLSPQEEKMIYEALLAKSSSWLPVSFFKR